jgi:predicted O-methyltransferase YrrM
MPRWLTLTDAIVDYINEASLREGDVLRQLRAETSRMTMGGMQIGPDQGQFMALLVRLVGARKCLEVGTFTGYSSLVVALALPPDGKVVCCDVSEAYTAVARRYWAMAGVADKIDLRLAPAADTLDRLLADGEAGAFDFAFIDADKTGYDGYYEAALKLVRPGGLIIFDNVLWSGAVADPARNDEDTTALRALNLKLRDDARIDLSMLGIGDGVTLARVR